MRRIVRVLVFATIVAVPPGLAAQARASSSRPRSGDVARQFNSGAQRVGHGAAEIGEGIKNGAIMTWQALRDGAHAVAHRFDGDRAGQGHNPGNDVARPARRQR